jgi:hypothetical protein
MLTSFHDAFWVMTGISSVGLVLSFFLHDRVLAEFKARGGQMAVGRASERREPVEATPAE